MSNRSGRITKRRVDAAMPGDRITYIWDAGDRSTKGFGLKVMPSGVKTYIFQYRMGGRGAPTRRFTIGKHGGLTPEQAREEAGRLKNKVATGVDPMEVKRASRARRLSERELAFSKYMLTFLEGYADKVRPRSHEFAESVLRLHALPHFKDKPVTQINKGDVEAMLKRIPAAQKAVRLNTFAMVRRLFAWAKDREDIAFSPCDNVEKPAGPESRNRVLTDHELAAAYRAALSLPYPIGPMFELLFATGQRREEAAGLRWEELDRAHGLWTLPRERAKNKTAHLIPLNKLAMAALDRAAGIGLEPATKWPRTGYVFTNNGKVSVSGHSKAKARLDAAMLAIMIEDARALDEDPIEELAHWRLHDARRTLATGFQKLGVRFEVTEAVLNHVSGSKSGVAGIYQRHDWEPEKRSALDAWCVHLERLLAPPASADNVVPLLATGVNASAHAISEAKRLAG